jgi:hypothetical protein
MSLMSRETLKGAVQPLRLVARQFQRLRTACTSPYPLANFNLQLFFEDALRWQNGLERQGAPIALGHYYEFGVYRGDTMWTFYRALKAVSRTTRLLRPVTLYAFDSFQGLPKPGNESDRTGFWREGQYACSQDEFLRRLRSKGVDVRRVVCVPGFYEQSLTPALAASLAQEPPSIITIDCDYYSSAITVLEWLRPLLRHGTLFYFDDIWSFCGHPEFGELRAIQEFNRKSQGLLVEHHLGLGTRRVWVYTNPPEASAR